MHILESYIARLERALLLLDREGAAEVILDAVKVGTPMQVAGELVTQTLQHIGDAWERGNLSLSQVYMSGIICEELIDKILPPASPQRQGQPKMAIGVFEDHHLLGKRIIYSTLRAGGYELMDLGGGLGIDELDRVVREEKIKILLLSVLMLPSALNIKKLKQRLSDTDVKIVVGGAPFRFDPNLWKEIGADASGNDPVQALEIVARLTGGGGK